MNLVVRRCLKRPHLIQELYEQWQIEHNEAMSVLDLEELCAECLELCQLWQRAWKILVDRLFEESLEDTERIGRALTVAMSHSLEIVGRVLALAEEAKNKGYAIAGREALQDALKELETLERKIARQWPFVDRKRIEKSRAAYKQGKFKTAEELLHAAQSGNP